MPDPRFVLLAGPNGSGKSTVSPTIVRDVWGITRFLNADTIARGLAGFDPDAAAVSAGRVMIEEARRHIAAGQSFAVETTLSGKTHARWLAGDLAVGWRTHLAFVYTRTPDENVLRVQKRVLSGGHNIPEPDVRRRYDRSFSNFFKLYRPLVQSWVLIDNTQNDPRKATPIASRPLDRPLEVYDRVEWERLEKHYA